MKEKGKCGFIFWSRASEVKSILVALKLECCVKIEALNRGLKKDILREWKRFLGLTVVFPCQIKSGNWGIFSKPISFFFFFFNKYFLELSIFLVLEQAKAVLETVLILDALCLARYELTSTRQWSHIPPLLLQRSNALWLHLPIPCPFSKHPQHSSKRKRWFHGNVGTTELLIRAYFLCSCRNRRKLGERSFKRGDKNLSEDLVITKWNVIFLGNESGRESYKDRLLLKSLLFSLVVSHVSQCSYLEVKGSRATCFVFLLQPPQHLIMGLE